MYRRLDGSTSHKDRQTRIKEFNSDRAGVFVFLVSTRGERSEALEKEKSAEREGGGG